MDDFHTEFDAVLAEHPIETGLAGRLAAYGDMLLRANRLVNLTGATTPQALVPHLLDALTLVPDMQDAVDAARAAGRPGALLVDVGSGGGLPGIPLALAVEGCRPVLIEPIRKKAAFLRDALHALELDGEALGERAETVARDPRFREQADVATARAVSRASTVAELTLPLVRVGGRALLQRGHLEVAERRALEDAAPILGGELIEERLLGGDLRVFVVLKRSPIGERFPRRNGVPEKRPLCAELR